MKSRFLFSWRKSVRNVFTYSLSLIAAVSSLALDLYVDPDSKATSRTGSVDNPFVNIQEAQEKVRALHVEGLTEHITIHLGPGDYTQSQPLKFGASDGGSNGFRVIYEGVPDATKIFSQLRVSDWKVTTGGHWIAQVADLDTVPMQIYINGQPRPRSRHPNQGFFRVQEAITERTQFRYSSDEKIPQPANAAHAQLGFLHDWSMSYVPIESIDQKSRTLTTLSLIGGPYPFWRITGFETNPRFFLENAPEWIDTPGEWSFNPENGSLQYFPLPGECPEKTTVTIPTLEKLIIVEGKEEEPVRDLIFRNLKFEMTAWAPDQGRYAGGQAGFHWSGIGAEPNTGSWKSIPAAVEVQNSFGVQFQSCQFKNLGGSGIWLGAGSIHGEISNCSLSQIAANGILLGEQNPGPDQISGDHLVFNNRIEECGTKYFGSVGLWIGLSPGNRVLHNEISNLPYTGVSVGWSWSPMPTVCGDNKISYNHIHHVMQLLSDGGGIYTLGNQPGTVLSYNVIHDVPLNLGRAESNGMFLDEGTKGILIEHNRIYGTVKSPLRFHKAETNVVSKNEFTLPDGIPMIRFNNTDEGKILIQD